MRWISRWLCKLGQLGDIALVRFVIYDYYCELLWYWFEAGLLYHEPNSVAQLLKKLMTEVNFCCCNIFSPCRCRFRFPKTIGKYSLNVMCCKRVWNIFYQEKTWMRAALMWRASWNNVSSSQWGFNLLSSLSIRLCCLAIFTILIFWPFLRKPYSYFVKRKCLILH